MHLTIKNINEFKSKIESYEDPIKKIRKNAESIRSQRFIKHKLYLWKKEKRKKNKPAWWIKGKAVIPVKESTTLWIHKENPLDLRVKWLQIQNSYLKGSFGMG